MRTIYCLKKAGVVFYVGATKRPRKRIYEHRVKWGKDVDFVLLEVVSEEVALEREVYWIQQFPDLSNITYAEHPNTDNNSVNSTNKDLPKGFYAKRNFLKIINRR